MTEATEQEATAMLAAELAAFLDDAIAQLDALGTRTLDQSDPPVVENLPEEVKPRKKKSPSPTQAGGPTIDPAVVVDAPPSDAAEHPVAA